MRKFLTAVVPFGVLFALGNIQAAEKPADPDEALLREAGIATDDAGLLAYLRKYAQRDDDLANLNGLVRQLGDPKLPMREEASKKLAALGLVALPALRQGIKDRDQEVSRRCRACIDEICGKNEWAWIGAAARRLLKTAPPGTAQALLAVLPYAVDEATEETIWFGLDRLASRDPKILHALAPALKDPFPARRALAACLLARLGSASQKDACKPLLADPDPTVRLRAAQGFLAGKDKAAIPVLIALLTEPATEIAWQAEELLRCVAEEKAPAELVGAGGTELQKKHQAAWGGWWARAMGKLDLANAELHPGLVLAAQRDPQQQLDPKRSKMPKTFDLLLYGCNGRARWKLSELPMSVCHFPCFQLVPSGQLFVGGSQRDLRGNVLWQIARIWDNSQRLPNGNVLVETNTLAPGEPSGLRELRPEGGIGYEMLLHVYARLSHQHLEKLPNGRLLAVDGPDKHGNWITKELEPFQHDGRDPKEVRRRTLKTLHYREVRFKLLPDGHFLTMLPAPGKVRELAPGGDLVRSWDVYDPRDAQLLPNGNILAAGGIAPDQYGYFEVDRAGRLVWEIPTERLPVGVRACFPLLRLGFRSSPTDRLTSVACHANGLQSQVPLIRKYSEARLIAMGPKAEAALPLLLDILSSKEDGSSWAAARVLLNLEQPVFRLLPGLFTHPRPAARWLALIVISKTWPKSKSYLPLVINALEDSDESVGLQAVLTLGSRGHEVATQAVPAFIKALRNKDSIVHTYCLHALKDLGSEAKPAVPELLRLVKDKKNDGRRIAAEALVEIAPSDKTTISTLIELLEDKESWYARHLGAIYLGRIGPPAKAALPALKRLLNDANADVRKYANEAIRLIDK